MLTREQLKDYLEYRDGHLWWIKKSGNQSKIGKRIGCQELSGYIKCSFFRRRYREHQLVFLYFKGYIPDYIDHINGDRSDNRIENLRDITNQQNSCNRKGVDGTSSIYKGVTWNRSLSKWQASIHHNYKNIYIGLFDCEIAAANAYDEKALEIHKEYAKVNFG